MSSSLNNSENCKTKHTITGWRGGAASVMDW